MIPPPEMEPARWHRLDKLLQSALDLPAGERDGFLQRACDRARELEREARSLLAEHDADGFLSAPAIAVAAREFASPATDDPEPWPDPLIGPSALESILAIAPRTHTSGRMRRFR